MASGGGRGGAAIDRNLADLLVSDWTLAIVNTPVVWRRTGPRHDCDLPVLVGRESVPDLGGFRVHMTANELSPTEPRVQYLTPQGWIRRLCVNTEHRPFGTTHKHRLVGPDMDDPYEPTDIPTPPLGPHVPAGALRAILEAFLAECSIGLGAGYTWTSPWRGA